MTHFGIICPPYLGHLKPFCVLGQTLQARGHQVTVLQIPDLELQVRATGLDFAAIGETIYQSGTLAHTFEQLAKLSGIEALRYSVQFCQQMAEILCQDAPSAIAQLGIDVLLVDQLEPAGETVAEFLGLPFICVSCAQAIHRRADVPPFFMPWPYDTSWPAQLRNQIAYTLLDRSCQPILRTLNHYRRQWHLPPVHQIYASRTQLAHISQQPEAFDFPIANLPTQFHYAGPFRQPEARSPSFPYARLTGQPLIYASLGTVQNTKRDLFYSIAAACENLDAQLVIAGLHPVQASHLPGNPLVVEYAPQCELLANACLTITHGGLNTVLDALSHGVPLVAIPITFEQPGTGARIQWTGTGEVISLDQVSADRLRTVIQQVLSNPTYRQNAQRMQQTIQRSQGVMRAADLIEQVLQIQPPVLAALS